MSLPLPDELAAHFLNKKFRGVGPHFYKNFEASESGLKSNLKSSVEFLSIGSLSESRLVELAWILDENIFQKMRFRAFGDAYVIGCFSWLCFYCEGKPLNFLSTLSFPKIAEALKIPNHKLSSLVLLDDAIQNIIKINGKTTCKKTKN